MGHVLSEELMAPFPLPIASSELRLSDVPEESARWPQIERFALTFDWRRGYQHFELEDQDLSKLGSSSSLEELRGHLFFEQRRWSDFGRKPDALAMEHIRRMIGIIRSKVPLVEM
jgi:hypothetical protein